jgi:23S rRNA pseudouridine955/2504/2580 synthase/23S rRNA pseudouridine1911/1915/1917 synthase
MKKWEVAAEDSGKKLLAFLQSRLGPSFSARQLKRAIESNLCQINGRTERFASATVGKGDRVSFAIDQLEKKAPFAVIPLYEDARLLIINKPAGIPSDSPELINGVRARYPNAELAHRLDRDTTGALLFGKGVHVRDELFDQFKNHHIRKDYLALVDGVPAKTSGRIDNFLAKKHVYQGQTCWGSDAKGLRAITSWKVLKKGNLAALVHCQPETGRTHQLRVHLSEINHPILGDVQYGKRFKNPYQPQRYMLHAWKITVEGHEVEAPLPEDFIKALRQTVGDWP